MSPAQQRMWFLNQFDPASAAYNIPLALHLAGPLDTAALTAAVTDVLDRHETLRTVFPATPDGPIQRVVPTGDARAGPDRRPDRRRRPRRRRRRVRHRRFRRHHRAAGAGPPVHHRRRRPRAGGGGAPHRRGRRVDGAAGSRPGLRLRRPHRRRRPGVDTAARPVRRLHPVAARRLLGDARRSAVTGRDATRLLARPARRCPGPARPAHRPAPPTAAVLPRRRPSASTLDPQLHRAVDDARPRRTAPPRSWSCTPRSRCCWHACRAATTSPSAPRSPVAATPRSTTWSACSSTPCCAAPSAATAAFSDLLTAVRDDDLDAFAHADLPFERLVDTLDPAPARRRTRHCSR